MYYDAVDLLDMTEGEDIFSFPCPCGDNFIISVINLLDNEDVADCASCSLILKVEDKSGVVDQLAAQAEKEEEEEEEEQPVLTEAPNTSLQATSRAGA